MVSNGQHAAGGDILCIQGDAKGNVSRYPFLTLDQVVVARRCGPCSKQPAVILDICSIGAPIDKEM